MRRIYLRPEGQKAQIGDFLVGTKNGLRWGYYKPRKNNKKNTMKSLITGRIV